MAKLAADESAEEAAALAPATKIKYPRGVMFMIFGKFFERFSFLGIQTVLIIYLTSELSYNHGDSTVIYHAGLGMQFLAAIIGALLSDFYLGKYRSIAVMSAINLVGVTIILLGSFPPLGFARGWTIFALFLVSFSVGCMKPVIFAFCGDQFQLPQQAAQLTSFVSWFYVTLKVGSLASATFAPILRKDFKCYGMDYCFPVVFGACTAFAVIVICSFFAGTNWYRIVPSHENVLVKVWKCILHARSKKQSQQRGSPTNTHWLDLAEPKFGKKLVNDSKVVINLLVLYLPVPVYWSLTEQTGSSFTIQATQMDGRLSSFYTIKPDQFQVVHSILIICLIPLFDAYVYPMLRRVGIKRPLQKMCIGGMLTTCAFVFAGLLQLRFPQDHFITPRDGICQLKIYNPTPCDYVMQSSLNEQQSFVLPSMEAFQHQLNATENNLVFRIKSLTNKCPDIDGSVELFDGKAVSYLLQNNALKLITENVKSGITDSHLVKILSPNSNQSLAVVDTATNRTIFEQYITDKDISLPPSDYIFTVNGGVQILQKTIHPSGVSTLLLASTGPIGGNALNHTWIEVKPPNTIHMLWLLPQYLALATGDVLFSVTGLNFTYSESPASMKTVVQAYWLLLLAFGNAIDIIVMAAGFFESKAAQTFAFAALMFTDILVFVWLANRYRPNEHITDTDQPEENELISKRDKELPKSVNQ